MNIQDTLLKSAFELFLKYGIKSVSMDDISKNLGISKKTIYTFVENKEELINNVVETHLKQDQIDIATITENSTDAIDEMVSITKHILGFLRKMTPSLIYDLKKYHHGVWTKIESKHFIFIQDVINKNLIRGQQEGVYRQDLDATIISKLYVLQSNTITDEDQFPLATFNRVVLFQEMIRYHLHGIVSDLGRQKLNIISLY